MKVEKYIDTLLNLIFRSPKKEGLKNEPMQAFDGDTTERMGQVEEGWHTGVSEGDNTLAV